MPAMQFFLRASLRDDGVQFVLFFLVDESIIHVIILFNKDHTQTAPLNSVIFFQS